MIKNYKKIIAFRMIDSLKSKILDLVENYFGSWDNLISKLEQYNNTKTAKLGDGEKILIALNLLVLL